MREPSDIAINNKDYFVCDFKVIIIGCKIVYGQSHSLILCDTGYLSPSKIGVTIQLTTISDKCILPGISDTFLFLFNTSREIDHFIVI